MYVFPVMGVLWMLGKIQRWASSSAAVNDYIVEEPVTLSTGAAQCLPCGARLKNVCRRRSGPYQTKFDMISNGFGKWVDEVGQKEARGAESTLLLSIVFLTEVGERVCDPQIVALTLPTFSPNVQVFVKSRIVSQDLEPVQHDGAEMVLPFWAKLEERQTLLPGAKRSLSDITGESLAMQVAEKNLLTVTGRQLKYHVCHDIMVIKVTGMGDPKKFYAVGQKQSYNNALPKSSLDSVPEGDPFARPPTSTALPLRTGVGGAVAGGRAGEGGNREMRLRRMRRCLLLRLRMGAACRWSR